jgi:hypothetical protein
MRKMYPSAKTTCRMDLLIFPYRIKLEAGGETSTGITEEREGVNYKSGD